LEFRIGCCDTPIEEGNAPLEREIERWVLREVADEPQVGETDRHLHSPYVRGPEELHGGTVLRVRVQAGDLEMVPPRESLTSEAGIEDPLLRPRGGGGGGR
jgi:hypothetical protein